MVPSQQLPQLTDAFVRLPRSAFHAVLLDLAGLNIQAQHMRLDAWQSHADGAALLHHALGRAYGGRETEGLEAMALQIGAAIREGVMRVEEATRLYTIAWAFAQAHLNSPELAEWFLMRRESLAPGERFPCTARPSGRTRKSQIIATSTCIGAAADLPIPATDRAERLLRLQVVSSPAGAPNYDRIHQLLGDEDTDEYEAGALISLLLCELDRMLINLSDSPLDRFVEFADILISHVRDYRSRELLNLRKLYAQYEHESEAALKLIDEFAENDVRGSLVESARELVYLRSLANEDLRSAARVALQRAREHSDLRFVAAWGLRGLIMLRDTDGKAEELAKESRYLAERCRRLKQESPILYQTLLDFAAGAMLQAYPAEDATRVARDESSPEYDLLRTILWLNDADVNMQFDGQTAVPPELRAFFASRASEHPGMTLHNPLFEEWGSDDVEFTISQYITFFTFQSPERVWHNGLNRLKSRSSISPEDIWVLWAAARKVNRLSELTKYLTTFQDKGSGDEQMHCRAALAESCIAMGDLRHARSVLQDFPDTEWADSIRRRAEELELTDDKTARWSVIAETHELLPETSDLREILDGCRRAIRRGRPRTAAKGFFEASRVTTDPLFRGDLLFMAARSIEEADAFSNRAIELYESALNFNPQQGRALSRLLALFARREDWQKLIETAGDCGKTRLNSDSRFVLQEAAIQLTSSHPSVAFDGWELALDRIAMSDSLNQTLERFELASYCALSAGRSKDFEHLLARLRERFVDTEFDRVLLFAERQYEQTIESLSDPLEAIRKSGFEPQIIRIAVHRMFDSMGRGDVVTELQSLDAPDKPAQEAIIQEILRILERSDLPASDKLQRVLSLEERTDSPWLGVAKSRAYRELGEFEMAATSLETSARRIKSHLDRSKLYRELGELYEERMSNPEVALENYLVSFICDSGNGATLHLLEEMYSSRQRYTDLIGAYDVAIAHITERNPSDLEETLLRAKRADLLVHRLDDVSGADKDLEWLQDRSSLPRPTVNYIIEHLRDAFSDPKIERWIARLGLEVSPDESQKSDAVALWTNEE